MGRHDRMFWMVLGVAVCAAAAAAQTERKLTARELFYTPVADTKSVKPPDAPKDPPKEVKTATRKPVPSKPSKPKVSPPPPTAGTEEPVVATTRTQTEANPLYQTVSNSTAPPLALRYTILKWAGDSDYVEVDPEMVFRSGDKIRVGIEANDNAYLYIVQQGSSKTWQLLFPNPEVENGNNTVERNRQYQIPGGARFAFDDQPGTERLFLVLTRQPEADLEKLIYALGSGAAKMSTPASTEPRPAGAKVMMASMREIDDGVISKLRGQVLARDLVFEKVDETKAGPAAAPKREKAMYIATEDRSPNARVIVDLNLNHR